MFLYKVWQLRQAKSQFSQLVNEVVKDGYHTITKNGEPIVVVVSKEEFERLSSQEMGVVDFFLKAPLPEVDIDVERNQDLGRDMGLFNPLH
ncbi:MAG: type II toxin-antitoxin system Phd/YefM family antitoxin [Chlamydiae bacterium]|nr:type II toxin-antitoxin system Phd/YefM family antitoxin [Chlamydiota bacterium]